MVCVPAHRNFSIDVKIWPKIKAIKTKLEELQTKHDKEISDLNEEKKKKLI